jgi:phosphatidylglycerophosphatase A
MISRDKGLILWIAQGFYIGRIPVAPGSFGSVLGCAWVGFLLWPNNVWVYVAGTVLGLACSVWVCGRAEIILGQTDPGSVVLDEIAAMPVCFAGWITIRALQEGQLPSLHSLMTGSWVWWMVGIFLAFRFFDIAKPWPVRQSQSWPGGWGVTIDDFLAAIYVNGGVLLVWSLLPR